MARRKRTKRISIKKGKMIISGPKSRSSDMRFKVSLVVLIAVLVFSVNLFLLSLNKSLADASVSSRPAGAVQIWKNPLKKGKTSDYILQDKAIDFKLTIPARLGDWTYKIGYAESPTDDTLSNQYFSLFVSNGETAKSKNFDENYQEILTIRKFSNSEWNKLEKGCDKGNLLYCETMGDKISEKDNETYTATKAENCRAEIQSKCNYISQIIDSFQMN